MYITIHAKNKTDRYKAIRKHIYNLFQNEYLPFVGLERLCKFEIRVQEKSERKIQPCGAEIIHENGTHTLQIAWETVEYGNDHAKSTLFHEFTHMLDHETLLQDVEFDKRSSLLSLYGEYHATIVEMKAACGFKTEQEVNRIPLDKNINAIVLMPLIDYIAQEAEGSIEQLIEWSKDNYNPNKLFEIMKFTMYYIGKVHFVQQYCIDSLSQIAGTEHLPKIFGVQISEIEEILQSNIPVEEKIENINAKHLEIAKNIITKHRKLQDINPV